MRLLVVLAFLCAASAQEPTRDIRVNQVGYLPSAPKFAMYGGSAASEQFHLKRVSDGKVVFTGMLGDPSTDTNSGDKLRNVDFTTFRTPGRYFIDIPGAGRSNEFAIAPDVYSRAWYLATRSFYGQRCGTAVDLGKDFPGYRYEECHRRGAWHASSGKSGDRESSYGWHDAGDYGRYVVNSGITTGTLLWSFEFFKAQIEKRSLHIPESGNGTPDLLNEIRWNLLWMLTMQDSDGGVWHKQTSERFAGFVMPQRDQSVSVAIGTGTAPFKSTCATADFAAVMAIAARVYRPYDAKFADRTRQAAASAWAWSEANPSVLYRNPQGVVTGAYGDGNCSDERLWASAELWRTTGESKYHDAFRNAYAGLVSRSVDRPPSWPNVGALGLWTYVLSGRKDIDSAARDTIRQAAATSARAITQRTLSNPYRTSMTEPDYVWGSNSVAMNYSIMLLVADRLEPSQEFRNAALENLHYVLGRNAFSVSWLTGVGSNSFKRPHHRPSGADDRPEPWPGLLSGGPNRGRGDAVLKALPANLPPMRVWSDDQESYAGNENAINWNAALVFVLSAVQ